MGGFYVVNGGEFALLELFAVEGVVLGLGDAHHQTVGVVGVGVF